MVSFDSTFTYDYINLKTIKDYDNRLDKIKYVPKDWTTSPFDLIGSTDNLDSVSMRGDLLRPEIRTCANISHYQAVRTVRAVR